MKQKILYLLLCAFLSGGVQTASAQSFWKKLGKVATGVLGAAASVSSSSSASSSSNESKIYVPHCTFTATDCVFWGDCARIHFTVTNNGNSELNLLLNNGDSYVTDENGTRHSVEFSLGKGSGTTLEGPNNNIPSGVTIKGTIFVSNVERGTTQLKPEVIIGRTTYSQKAENFQVSLPAKSVTYPDNTNASNVTCAMPVLSFEFKSCKRSGNNVIVEGTVTNNSGIDFDISLEGNALAYDSPTATLIQPTVAWGK